MKKTTYLILLILFSLSVYGQAPQGINYQGLALDEEGKPIRNQEIGIKMSILTSSSEGATIYAEEHNIESNAFGLFNLVIGEGKSQNGEFSEIEWGEDPKFLKLEIDKSGGQNYKLLGVTQFLSVPYALYAEKTKSSIIAGEGIKLDGDSLINSLPDREILLTGTGSTEVTGAYPNFNIHTKDSIITSDIFIAGEGMTISGDSLINTSPDQEIHLTGSGLTEVTGVYPNFNIHTIDSMITNDVEFKAGVGINISGDSLINTLPDKEIHLTGSGLTEVTGVYPNFNIHTIDSVITNDVDFKAGNGINISGDSLINTLPDQEILLTGTGSTEVTGTYPNFIIHTKDSIITSDIDSTNEIQYLSYENNQLSLSKGNSITFPEPDSMWFHKNDNIIYNLNRKLGLGTSSPSSYLHIENETSGLDPNRFFITLNNQSIDDGSSVAIKLQSGSSGSSTVIGHHSSSYGNLTQADYGQIMSTGNGLILRSYSTNGILSFQTGKNGAESYERMRLSNDGNLGIGTVSPKAKLQVTDGDVYIENIDKGIIMKSPNGNCWRVTIDDSGDFVKTQITCP